MSNSNPDTVRFRAMRFLTWGSIAAGVALVISAMSGVSAVYLSHEGTRIAYHTPGTRLLAAILVPLLFAFAYGLHRRALIVWHAGLVLPAVVFLCAVGGAWTELAEAPLPVRLIFVGLAAAFVGSMLLSQYRWWQQQRPYFDDDSRPA